MQHEFYHIKPWNKVTWMVELFLYVFGYGENFITLSSYVSFKKKKKLTLFIFLGDRTLTAEPVEVIVYLLKY